MVHCAQWVSSLCILTQSRSQLGIRINHSVPAPIFYSKNLVFIYIIQFKIQTLKSKFRGMEKRWSYDPNQPKQNWILNILFWSSSFLCNGPKAADNRDIIALSISYNKPDCVSGIVCPFSNRNCSLYKNGKNFSDTQYIQ